MKSRTIVQEINGILQEFEDIRAKNIQWTENNVYILEQLTKRSIDKVIVLLNS